MTVAFKEFSGSPVETFGPEGMAARRVLLCAWDDRRQVVEELLGDGQEYGGRGRAQYPDRRSVVAMRTRCEPLIDDIAPQVLSELTEGLNTYGGFAKVTVDYEFLAASDRDDLPSTEERTYLTYRQDFGVDTLALPGHALSWLGSPTVPVPPESVPRIRVPIVEHYLTWHRVLSPPWQAIRNSVGTVNSSALLGAAAGTMRFDGATADREFVRIDDFAQPELAWRIGYVFREKAVKTSSGSVIGWNQAYRSLPVDSPGWDELIDAGGNRLYQLSDFSPLFYFASSDQ